MGAGASPRRLSPPLVWDETMNHGTELRVRSAAGKSIQGDADMKRMRLTGFALIPLFALGAFASASASAENPEILPVPTAAAPLNFTATGGEPTLQATKEANRLRCAKETAKGSFTTQDKGIILIAFEGCEGKGAACTSPGDAKGVELTKGVVEFVDVLPTATLDLGVLITPTEAGSTADLKFECAGVFTVEVLQSFVGIVDNAKGELLTANTKTKEIKALWKSAALGEQEIKTCDLLKATCEGKAFGLAASFGKGEELVAEIADAALTFEKEAEVHF
jgi:hypothetical protein